MFGIAAIIASVSRGTLLTAEAFTLIGLLCLAVHVVLGWLPIHRA